MKYSYIIFFLLFGMSSAVWGASIPIMHEIVIDGVIDAPQLSISDLQLEVNEEYLFVVDNKFAQSLSFNFEKFGQHVSTRYLQGSSSVTQESFTLLPNSKVVWHFTAVEPGSFSLYVVDPATMRQSNKVKLEIPVKDQKTSKEENKTVEKEAEKAEPSKEKKFMLSRLIERLNAKVKEQ